MNEAVWDLEKSFSIERLLHFNFVVIKKFDPWSLYLLDIGSRSSYSQSSSTPTGLALASESRFFRPSRSECFSKFAETTWSS